MAPFFFMAHLEKLPTYFVKGDERRAAYYTVQARELREAGYVEEGEKAAPAPAPKPMPEVVVEAGADAFELEAKLGVEEKDLDAMTKAELMYYAEEHGIECKPAMSKAEILKLCKAA